MKHSSRADELAWRESVARKKKTLADFDPKKIKSNTEYDRTEQRVFALVFLGVFVWMFSLVVGLWYWGGK